MHIQQSRKFRVPAIWYCRVWSSKRIFFPAVQDKTETNLFYQQVFDFFSSKKQQKMYPGHFLGGIPRVVLKKITMPCVPLEKFSGLQRYCFNFFVPSMPLPSVWALTPSNYMYEKTKIPLSLNMPLIFLSILTTSNEKTQN